MKTHWQSLLISHIIRNACFMIAFFLAGCATLPPPTHSQDLCRIFQQYPAWLTATENSARRWGVPAPVQMSIMYQESSFRAGARPARRKILGFIPGSRPTSAYGYCQAVNGTWRLYQRNAGHYVGGPDSLAGAADFIGWYGKRAHLRAGIPMDNAYLLYLAYHEGITNFMRGSYLHKTWLIKTARKVQARASLYRAQWLMCQ